MIEEVTEDVIAYYDTNNDNSINPEDFIDDEHYGELTYACDFNYDGTIDACEIHTCIVMCEYEWRLENCPAEFDAAYCACPYVMPACDGAWNCLDIVLITDEVVYEMDTNYDG
jgi:hypothetical protein